MVFLALNDHNLYPNGTCVRVTDVASPVPWISFAGFPKHVAVKKPCHEASV